MYHIYILRHECLQVMQLYVLIAAKCTRKDATDTYMLEIQLNHHLRLPLVSDYPAKHKTSYSQSNHYSSREDKGDREGIPHTHPIP